VSIIGTYFLLINLILAKILYLLYNYYMRETGKKQFNSTSYNVMDANKTFFYVILVNILAPIVLYAFMFLILLPLAKVLPQVVYDTIYSLFLVLLMPLLYVTVIIIFHKKVKVNPIKAMNVKDKINPLVVMLIVLIAVVCVVCFFPLINMLYALVERLGFNVSGTVAFEMTNVWRLLVGVIVYCLLPAVIEEIIFRGILLNGWLKRTKPYVAIILSATAFFIMHGSIQQSFYQIILGLILSLLGYYCGSIVYPIIFHFLNNLFVILISYFGIGGYLNGFAFTVGGVFAGIGLFALGVIAIFGLIVLIKYIMSKKGLRIYEFEEGTNNIIVSDDNAKFDFKTFYKSLIMDEKFYFLSAWIVAIIMWVFNSL